MDANVDNNGPRFFSFLDMRKMSSLKKMMCDGIQIVSGATIAAFLWKTNLHPMWSLTFSAMSLEGVIYLFKDTNEFIHKLSDVTQERIWRTSCITMASVVFFANLEVFSSTWNNDSKIWVLPLIISASSYYVTILFMKELGRTFYIVSPLSKCAELLFGPALLAGAAFYLIVIGEHDETWIRCLPLIGTSSSANHMAFEWYCREPYYREPELWLFEGIELMISGSVLYTVGDIFLIYTVNEWFNPWLVVAFLFTFLNGLADLAKSLRSFQKYSGMDPEIFGSISGMIIGPIVFLTGCINVICMGSLMKVPIFCSTAGTGILTLSRAAVIVILFQLYAWSSWPNWHLRIKIRQSVTTNIANKHSRVQGTQSTKLYSELPEPIYVRCVQRVLGPVLTVYSSLASAYIGYRMGWRYSLVMMPLIPLGLSYTYKGFRLPPRL